MKFSEKNKLKNGCLSNRTNPNFAKSITLNSFHLIEIALVKVRCSFSNTRFSIFFQNRMSLPLNQCNLKSQKLKKKIYLTLSTTTA